MDVWYVLLFAWFVVTAMWIAKAFKDHNKYKWDRPKKSGGASTSGKGG